MSQLQLIAQMFWDQIFLIGPYWLGGLCVGCLLTTFFKEEIKTFAMKILKRRNILHLIVASLLGAVSPITLFGIIPIIILLAQVGVPHYILVAFTISSILINPNIFIFTFALGTTMAVLRLLLCVLGGVLGGILVKHLYKSKPFLYIDLNYESKTRQSLTGGIKSFLYNFYRAIRKTAPNLLIGISLAIVIELYMPTHILELIFIQNRGLAVLFSVTLGVGLYYCGGGTIPLINTWLHAGMGKGAAMAFMLTGPITKMTNVAALRIVMKSREVVYLISFVVVYGAVIGIILDIFLL